MGIKTSKRKKITGLTFYAFYSSCAFYSFYACEITLINSFTILLMYIYCNKPLLTLNAALVAFLMNFYFYYNELCDVSWLCVVDFVLSAS